MSDETLPMQVLDESIELTLVEFCRASRAAEEQVRVWVLEGVLKLSEESIRDQQNLSYMREPAEALAAARGEAGKQAANIAFLMNPCPVQKMREVALAGEVMPQKSTDFYPKLLSGLTAYALD